MTFMICIWFCILYLWEALPCLLPVVLWEMLWTKDSSPVPLPYCSSLPLFPHIFILNGSELGYVLLWGG